MDQTKIYKQTRNKDDENRDFREVLQNCLSCGEKISAFPGSKDAICPNCGYKEPCCE